MDNDLQKIYSVLKETKLFENMPKCVGCNKACVGEKWKSWLLKEEFNRLKNYFKITKVGNAIFFKDGKCSLFKDGRCSIYEIRPLECRLNPVAFLKIDNELWWILNTSCPVINKTKDKDLKKLIQKVKDFIEKIEPYFTPEIQNQIVEICEAINTFTNLKENVDFIRIIKAFK